MFHISRILKVNRRSCLCNKVHITFIFESIDKVQKLDLPIYKLGDGNYAFLEFLTLSDALEATLMYIETLQDTTLLTNEMIGLIERLNEHCSFS